MLKILLFVLSFLVAFSLESFFSVLGGFSILIVLILFLINKLDWKYVFFVSILFSLTLDVVNHSVLGTTLLTIGVAVLFFYLLGLFIPEQRGVLGAVPFLVSFLVFYIFGYFVREFVLLGSFPVLEFSGLVGIFFKSVISSFVVLTLDVLYDRVRGNKIGSKFTFR